MVLMNKSKIMHYIVEKNEFGMSIESTHPTRCILMVLAVFFFIFRHSIRRVSNLLIVSISINAVVTQILFHTEYM